MTTTSGSPTEDARALPPEPTARWILVLVAGLTILWLAVLAWQVAVLPERVPTHFDGSGQADGWSSRTGALLFSVLGPLVVVFPMPLMAKLAVRWPQSINAPNRDWWMKSGQRLRRFERLLREDLWLIAAATMLVLVLIQAAITETAVSGAGAIPMASLWVPLVVLFVVIGWVMARMMGKRYAEQPDLN